VLDTAAQFYILTEFEVLRKYEHKLLIDISMASKCEQQKFILITAKHFKPTN